MKKLTLMVVMLMVGCISNAAYLTPASREAIAAPAADAVLAPVSPESPAAEAVLAPEAPEAPVAPAALAAERSVRLTFAPASERVAGIAFRADESSALMGSCRIAASGNTIIAFPVRPSLSEANALSSSLSWNPHHYIPVCSARGNIAIPAEGERGIILIPIILEVYAADNGDTAWLVGGAGWTLDGERLSYQRGEPTPVTITRTDDASVFSVDACAR